MSAISTIIIILGKERGRTWLESIKTSVCLVQGKYLFCIRENMNTVTKQPRETATQSFSAFNMPLQGRGFSAFILRDVHQDLNWMGTYGTL